MPKGKTVISYAEQEELVVRILALAPRTSQDTIARLFTENWGIAFTSTNFRRAKERLEGTPVKSFASEKLNYLVAVLARHPHMTNEQIRAKTKLYFNEDTRSDLVSECRIKAQGVDPSNPQDDALISRCEARLAPSSQFDLSDDGAGADLERPA